MKALWILFVVLAICAENSALAGYCGWIKRREFVRYELEKTLRKRFSGQINRKIQEFLDSLGEVDRAGIRTYGTPFCNRSETVIRLRRKLDVVASGFNSARCSEGKPEFEGYYPSKEACTELGGDPAPVRPSYYRGLRLLADSENIFVEGELRQDSRQKLIRPHGDFGAGDYLILVTLSTPEEERRQIASAAAGFNFDDFDDFLESDEWLPLKCKGD